MLSTKFDRVFGCSRITQYTVAVVLTAATVIFRNVIGVAFQNRPLLILFVFPICVSAALGGFWAGMVSTVISCVATYVFFIPKISDGILVRSHDFAQWIMLFFNGVIVSVLCEILHISLKSVKMKNIGLEYGERRLHVIADNTYNWEYWQLPDGTMSWVSPACKRISGYAVEDFMLGGDSLLASIVYEDDKLIWRRHCDEVNGQKKLGSEVNFRIVKKSGEVIWISHTCTRIFDYNGLCLGHRACNRDVTEKYNFERILTFLATCSSGYTGKDFFMSLAVHLAEILKADFVCIDRLEGDTLAAHTLAMYKDGRYLDNISYALKDTPCGETAGKKVCCFPRDVRELFPKDAFLQELEAESYVGVTLWDSSGRPNGLIAVIWRRPLEDTSLAESILQMAGVRASGELERLVAEVALRESEHRFNQLAEQSRTVAWEVDPSGLYTYISHVAQAVMGYLPEEIVKKMRFYDLHTVIDGGDSRGSSFSAFERGEVIRGHVNPVRGKGGEIIWVSTDGFPLLNDDGSLRGFRGSDRDVTVQKLTEEAVASSLREKEVLLREIHHRVKNNLQIISSLLSLKAEGATGPGVRSVLDECRSRVASMALVHDKLYKSQDFTGINALEYLRDLAERLISSYAGHVLIDLKVDAPPVELDLDQSIPFGLIVNELITNALKHAFQGRERGEIRIVATENDGVMELLIEDDGAGLPDGFAIEAPGSLGLQIVSVLCQQLHGSFSARSANGASFLLRFPLQSGCVSK